MLTLCKLSLLKVSSFSQNGNGIFAKNKRIPFLSNRLRNCQATPRKKTLEKHAGKPMTEKNPLPFFFYLLAFSTVVN